MFAHDLLVGDGEHCFVKLVSGFAAESEAVASLKVFYLCGLDLRV